MTLWMKPMRQSSLHCRIQAMQLSVAMMFPRIPSLIMTVHQWLILKPLLQAKLESVSSKSIIVDLSSVSAQDITVNYAVTGTATGSGTDYTLADGTLTISAGSSTGTITVAGIVNDGTSEGSETVILSLSSPSNATLGSDDVHTFTILEPQVAPDIDFANASSSGAESVSSKDITIELSESTWF